MSSSDEESIACLVCFSNPLGGGESCKWFQCPEGHLLCEACHQKKVLHERIFPSSSHSCHDFLLLSDRCRGPLSNMWYDCWQFAKSGIGSVGGESGKEKNGLLLSKTRKIACESHIKTKCGSLRATRYTGSI